MEGPLLRLLRHRPTERSPATRAQFMRMAPSGQAETQCSSLVQAPTWTTAPGRTKRSRQPWGQIELHSPHALQRSRRTEGTHFWDNFTLVPRTATDPMIAQHFPRRRRYNFSRPGTRWVPGKIIPSVLAAEALIIKISGIKLD